MTSRSGTGELESAMNGSGLYSRAGLLGFGTADIWGWRSVLWGRAGSRPVP